MKLKVLSLLVPALLVAGTAHAAEIYNKDGNKLDLYGKVDAEHYFSDDDGADGDQTYMRIGFKGETQVNDQITGYGQWEYQINANTDESENNAWTRVAFAGLRVGDAGSLDYGRNYGVIYDIGAWTDVLPEFGGDTYGSDNFLMSRANGVLTYRNSDFFGLVDGLNFALQYQGKNGSARGEDFDGRKLQKQNGDGYGLSATYDLGAGFAIGGAMSSSKRTWDQTMLKPTPVVLSTTPTTSTWRPCTPRTTIPPASVVVIMISTALLTKRRTLKWLLSTSSTSVCVRLLPTCSRKVRTLKAGATRIS